MVIRLFILHRSVLGNEISLSGFGTCSVLYVYTIMHLFPLQVQMFT